MDFVVFDDREGLLLVFQCVVHCDINGREKGRRLVSDRSRNKKGRGGCSND